jgi:hypothetical protein
MLKTVSTQLALASDTLPEVLAKGNTTGGTDLAVSSGDDITFADNSKAIFGAGSDLSIYSDGTTGQVSGNVNVIGQLSASNTTISGLQSSSILKVSATSGNDAILITALSAGNGGLLGALNDGLSDYEPLKLLGETIQFDYRTGVGTSTAGMFLDTSGQLSVPAGVLLGGTAAANLLDDYEEGAWTPAFSGGDYTFTYNKQKGSYTKIGNRVYVDMVLYVHPSTAPSGTTDGNLSVTGLPYAFNKQNDVDSIGGIVTFKQLFLTTTETVATRLSDTGTSFLLYSTLATNYPDSGFAQASSVGANVRIRIQFSYPTNG